MKATELRIGNVLTFLDKQVTVVAITETHTSIKGYEFNRYTPVALNYKGLQGIELTEEILLKFGFEQNTFGFKKGNIVFNYRFDNKFIPKLSDQCLLELKHVHQLQNLYFALTGEELEVKL
ncbi:hypothetical protein ACR79R_20170 [Sphingobacterium spiritivorum]|uniref:hypothetical protein n=1 Tax=Sphingobacterium spiritivorum TaxID=258 RepID=UPI003DA6CC28